MSEGKPSIDVANDAELMTVIHACEGIFTALDWIDEGFLDERVFPKQIKNARACLLLAGKTLCEQAADRF